MTKRKEVPYDPMLRAPHGLSLGAQQRSTMYGTLMECAPGQDPQVSQEELLPLRDTLEDAMDTLTERERWVINALVVEQQSLRRVGRDLSIGKTQVARIRDTAVSKLQAQLRDQPTIKEYLDGQ